MFSKFRSNRSSATSGSNALPLLTFSEDWFSAFDTAIATANDLGVRLIIPFISMINLPQWGGVASLSRWAGVPASQFFHSVLTRSLYKQVVFRVLTRKNLITGRLYKDEPAIFGWELGECCLCVRARRCVPKESDTPSIHASLSAR